MRHSFIYLFIIIIIIIIFFFWGFLLLIDILINWLINLQCSSSTCLFLVKIHLMTTDVRLDWPRDCLSFLFSVRRSADFVLRRRSSHESVGRQYRNRSVREGRGRGDQVRSTEQLTHLTSAESICMQSYYAFPPPPPRPPPPLSFLVYTYFKWVWLQIFKHFSWISHVIGVQPISI